MPTENQHWVPKFLIKHFADVDGRVFCLDIQSDKITKPPEGDRHEASSRSVPEIVADAVNADASWFWDGPDA